MSHATAFDHAGAAERITIEPAGKRMRAALGGETIAESDGALVMHETGYPPRVYFPQKDVRMGLLQATDHSTRCPFKGHASYWTLGAAGRTIENAAWAYLDPIGEVASIKGHLSFVDEIAVEG